MIYVISFERFYLIKLFRKCSILSNIKCLGVVTHFLPHKKSRKEKKHRKEYFNIYIYIKKA